MKPLESDLDYMQLEPAQRPATAASRSQVLLALPVLGILLALCFISAAVFQWNLTDLIDSLMGVLILFFFIMIALLFWVMAPGAKPKQP